MSTEKIIINKEITVEHIKGVKMVKVMTESEMDSMAAAIANGNGKMVYNQNWTDGTGTEKEYHIMDIPQAPPEVTKEPEGNPFGGNEVNVTSEDLAREGIAPLESLTSESVESVLEATPVDRPLPPVDNDVVPPKSVAPEPINGKKKR